jgi:hypothetical protein
MKNFFHTKSNLSEQFHLKNKCFSKKNFASVGKEMGEGPKKGNEKTDAYFLFCYFFDNPFSENPCLSPT